ncbi:MAG: hypothetical protein DMF50_05375 [Acidobacteria bacterium]|nr:MAG: hypothetical protein DMF50_05375 [Acidobacteriota bacterium]
MSATHPAPESRLTRAGPALLLALLFAGLDAPPGSGQVRPPVTSPPASPRPRRPGDEAAEGLHKAAETLEKAFTRGDARDLRGLLPRRLKTYVSSRALAIADGYYGSDQVLLILRRIFERRVTLRFAPLEAETRPRARARATFSALWVFRDEDAPASEARITFVFAPEGSAWTIREIRDIE